ncbi:uncharacterized protein M421DRAFT_212174 [Didymella exigua CBS 183.55]|uniref:Uncharacterized protein n=1 Tax=Didymella exigua CBS 183.55 TaxID=1150837 RepID=A0A6A5RFV3_9PLEO|nr:uncharacterized protein M421DRAFT_212174 [Didymella exigua CBS 183.55]KAF1926632.1 hypothetical protein M421DRAFT_212174 [Didymella exigua CBS 183.55]
MATENESHCLTSTHNAQQDLALSKGRQDGPPSPSHEPEPTITGSNRDKITEPQSFSFSTSPFRLLVDWWRKAHASTPTPTSLGQCAADRLNVRHTYVQTSAHTDTSKACDGLQASFHVRCVCQNGPVACAGESKVATLGFASNSRGVACGERCSCLK